VVEPVLPVDPEKKVDPAAVLAVAWIWVAVGLTVVFAPHLGLRGWLWLGMHHVLCVVGVGHELRGYRSRRREVRERAMAMVLDERS